MNDTTKAGIGLTLLVGVMLFVLLLALTSFIGMEISPSPITWGAAWKVWIGAATFAVFSWIGGYLVGQD